MTRCAQTQPAFSSTNQVQDVGSDLSIAILVPTGESNAGTGRAPTGVGRSGDIVSSVGMCRPGSRLHNHDAPLTHTNVWHV
jgi:hypothetical protein